MGRTHRAAAESSELHRHIFLLHQHRRQPVTIAHPAGMTPLAPEALPTPPSPHPVCFVCSAPKTRSQGPCPGFGCADDTGEKYTPHL